MSERIDVNAAFDPELRQAQKDMDDYVNSRPETDEADQDILGDEGTYIDAIDREIAKDPTLRRMLAMADEIRTIGEKHVTVKEADQLARMRNDKMDKLTELLQRYDEGDSKPGLESKEDVINRIINRTEDTPAEALLSEEEADDEQAEDQSNEESNKEEPVTENASDAGNKAPNEAESKSDEHESEQTPFTEADQAELNKKLVEEDNHIPKHRGEYQDEESPIYDELKREMEGDDAGVKEGESLEEFEDRQPGKHRSTGHEDDKDDEDLEMLPVNRSESTLDEDLEILDVPQTAAPRAGRIQRFGTPAGVAAEVGAWAATRERGGRRNRTVALLGGVAAAVATGWLLMKGHDVSGPRGGGSGVDVTGHSGTGINSLDPTNGTGAGDRGIGTAIHAEAVRVNPGDGEIKITQRILDANGVHVNTTQAQQIGEHAGVHDILKGDDSYAHSGSTMDRIGETGTFKVRKGVTAKLLSAASKLKLK